MNFFKYYASVSSLEFLNNTMQGDSIETVNKIRDELLSDIFETEPTYWFTQITKKINLLKKVDDNLANNLISNIKIIKAKAKIELIFSATLSFLVVIFVLFLGRVIALERSSWSSSEFLK